MDGADEATETNFSAPGKRVNELLCQRNQPLTGLL